MSAKCAPAAPFFGPPTPAVTSSPTASPTSWRSFSASTRGSAPASCSRTTVTPRRERTTRESPAREARAARPPQLPNRKPPEIGRLLCFMEGNMASVKERQAQTPALGLEISEEAWAYHEGDFVRLADAKVSLATHALNYGTGIF